jgi:hypothetical protein
VNGVRIQGSGMKNAAAFVLLVALNGASVPTRRPSTSSRSQICS